MNQAAYLFLALCARPNGGDFLYERLARYANDFNQWQELPGLAEVHGVGGLFLHHSREAGVRIPDDALRMLNGMQARIRVQDRLYTNALKQTLSVLQDARITPLVLKGLALANQYYPHSSLRPTSDLDLLIQKADARPALEALTQAGYTTRLNLLDLNLIPREWTVFSPEVDGLRVQIELHYHDPRGRSENNFSPDREFYMADIEPLLVQKGDLVFYTSNPYRTWLYLSGHLQRHLFDANDQKPLKLKWIADILGLVEFHYGEWDWDLLHKKNPGLLEQLRVFYHYIPMPGFMKQVLQPAAKIHGVNQYPLGWPQQKFADAKKNGWYRFFVAAFTPPAEWWLRLYYGIAPPVLVFYGHVVYPLQIAWRMFWRVLQFLFGS